LVNNDSFGRSVSSIGDLDGDGITDLAIGALNDDTGGPDRGAVYILFMNADGTVSSSQKIASGTGGMGTIGDYDMFGISVSSIGDLDSDGVVDLAVGTFADDAGGVNRGSLHILFMNTDGTVSSSQRITHNTAGFGALIDFDRFGYSVSPLGDLNGDDIIDLAVGAIGDHTVGTGRGAIYILFMNADGTVASSQKIASGIGGFGTLVDYDSFGSSISSLGDLDGDDITDLVVGTAFDDTNGSTRGAVYILFMNADGTVSSTQKIADNTGGFGTLVNSDMFGYSVSSLGDLNNDGITDLAVGAVGDNGTRGAVYILFMNADGTVSSSQKIADSTGGFGVLTAVDAFGGSISPLGDFNGDGVSELAVGTFLDDTNGTGRGAVYVLFMDRTSSSHLEVTVPDTSTFTLVSSDKHQLSNDASLITNCLENESSLIINGSATVNITPFTEVCTVAVSSNSSGGSSRKSSSNPSISVNPPVTNPAPSLESSTPSSFTYNLGLTTLKIGSFGLTVQQLQQFLNTQNFTLVVDGKFGPLTSSAVKQWQQANGLTPDGLVGPLTRGKMGA
jgi:hypothetical protein